MIMLLYTEKNTTRLQYITDFTGSLLLQDKIQVTTDINYFKKFIGAKINYSSNTIDNNEFRINPVPLLFETVIKPQNIDCFETGGNKAFYKTAGDFPFDIFAASFYLLSRYEEYLPHQKDIYGRYAYENSIAFKNNFLHLPLINIWQENFKKELHLKFPGLQFVKNEFRFIPTYDIDIAWSYSNKGFFRNTGGFIKDMLGGRWTKLTERSRVLRGKQKDPFDAYDWMDALHEKYDLKPYYFFPVAEKTGKYDKNISPYNFEYRNLIQQCSRKYKIGVHPSWQSGDERTLTGAEKKMLGKIAGNTIDTSRQHFIRFTLPETYRQLIRYEIKNEFSMGYGSINGFRASVASPFYWYDLAKEETTDLLVYPFCFMDANSFFEQKFTPQQALAEIKKYYNNIKAVNGAMITIWHNPFLGTDDLFTGRRKVYEEFVREVTGNKQ
jgi:hypothetical protein